MPIVKSADVFVEAVAIKHQDPVSTMRGDKIIHPEIMRYFDLQPASISHKDQLQAINDWAFDGASNSAHAMQKINQLQSKIGAADMGEAAIAKLSNYIRMNKAVNYTQAELNRELKGFANRHKEVEIEVGKNTTNRIQDLEKQLGVAKVEHKRALNNWKLQGNIQTKNIKDRYAKDIKELTMLQEVYGGKK